MNSGKNGRNDIRVMVIGRLIYRDFQIRCLTIWSDFSGSESLTPIIFK